MFEIGAWEENTDQEKKLVCDLFGNKFLPVDKDTDSTRKKKIQRKKKESTLSDTTGEEKDDESHPKQLDIAEEDISLESEVIQNGKTKIGGKKRKTSCSSPESTDTLVSSQSIGITTSKKRRERRKRQKQGEEKSMTEDEKGNKKWDKGKKKKDEKIINEVTTDMSYKPDVVHQNSIGELNTDKVKITPTKHTELQGKLKSKLESSRFRWINEQLYTITGDEALQLFEKDQSMFDVYHQGFRRQVEHWPVNPVDVIIDWVKQRPKSLVLADFGCGDAAIAQSVPNKVYSFDLVAKNEWVTACNMAKVPLSSGSIDVAVFCLSLMGTDLESFVREAHRVLKPGGMLKIAEVVSRIDVKTFIPSLCQLGFKVDSMDDSNKMFILIDLLKDHQTKKSKTKPNLADLSLKPCIYKRR